MFMNLNVTLVRRILCNVCPILAVVKSKYFLDLLLKEEQFFRLRLSTDNILMADRRVLQTTYHSSTPMTLSCSVFHVTLSVQYVLIT